MIPGSGPGRGRPWWRRATVLNLRWVPGDEVPELGIALGRTEPVDARREGRMVAVIEETST